MTKTFYISIVLITLCALCGCRKPERETSSLSSPIAIERLDLFVTDFTPSDSANSQHLNPGLSIYLSIMGCNNTDTIGELNRLHNSSPTQTFGLDVKQTFGPTDAIEKELGVVSAGLQRLLPVVSLKKIYGVISPYNQSVIVSDSIVLIALNHYMGPDYAAYNGMPEYIRAYKIPERIPIDVAEALIRVNFPYIPSDDPTLLERMLYEGAVYASLKDIFPDKSDSTILGVSPASLKDFKNNKEENWSRLSAAGALYSTQPETIGRLLSPVPEPLLLMPGTPGKAASLFGDIIVSDYRRNHPETQVSTLLSPDFYHRAQRRLIEATR